MLGIIFTDDAIKSCIKYFYYLKGILYQTQTIYKDKILMVSTITPSTHISFHYPFNQLFPLPYASIIATINDILHCPC
jgi:hypothetical protein